MPTQSRGDVNLRSLLQDLNAPRLIVFTALLVYSLLFALKLDMSLNWSWWSIFTPLWVWKGLAVAGAGVGSYVWWRRPHSRLNAEEYIQYKAMLISMAVHLLLLMFELLAADNLQSAGIGSPHTDSPRHLWILVFVPLVFVSLLSVAVCIWSVRHDRSFELELFCAVNILQFIFLALKLDKWINWRWEITFIPLWIVLCISLVGVLYTIIFAGILLRIPEVNMEQRRTSTNSALGYSFLVVPLLVFLVLLTNKLDGSVKMTYFAAFSPLYFTFFTLVIASFGSRGGNRYWFGLRRPPCQFLFTVCPCLQLFGNISYSLYSNRYGAGPSSGTDLSVVGGEGMGNGGGNPEVSDGTSQTDISVVGLERGERGRPLPSIYFPESFMGGNHKKNKKSDQVVVPVLTLEMPD